MCSARSPPRSPGLTSTRCASPSPRAGGPSWSTTYCATTRCWPLCSACTTWACWAQCSGWRLTTTPPTRIYPVGHWFWDDALSGGILLEHGVHFFDAAAMLIGAPARHVQAIGTTRPDGRTDTVVCTVAHAGGSLATHAHGFTHAHRAERQLMRLDYGLAEARVHGWIPLRADLDIWTDRVDSFEQLPGLAADILAVPGVRPSGREHIAVTADRNAAPAAARARGLQCYAPHHVTVCIDLGGPDLKQPVYRESVRAALWDLAACARTGAAPRANIDIGYDAIQVAAAGTRALHDGRTHHLPNTEESWPAAP